MPISFNVAPRYTCGSPALVGSDIAEQVAREERRAYECHLEGIYGDDKKREAEENGLGLIAFTMKETRKGWVVVDLITDEEHFWPFKTECPTCGLKRVECSQGVLGKHQFKGTRSTCNDRRYMGTRKESLRLD